VKEWSILSCTSKLYTSFLFTFESRFHIILLFKKNVKSYFN